MTWRPGTKRDTEARRFARQAVAAWAGRLNVRVGWTTTWWGDWQRRHGPYRGEGFELVLTPEEKAQRCVKVNRQPAPGPSPIGMSCHQCRGIIVAINELQTNRRLIWQTACHEVLHLQHPYWQEERVETAAKALCDVWPYWQLMPAWRTRKQWRKVSCTH